MLCDINSGINAWEIKVKVNKQILYQIQTYQDLIKKLEPSAPHN